MSAAFDTSDLFTPAQIPHEKLENALQDACSAVLNNVRRIGDRNPKIGWDNSVKYRFCPPRDWVCGFWAGQLWLAYKVTGESRLRNSAAMRHPYFKTLLDHPEWMDHDLGFQFSLSCVAQYKLTGCEASKTMALKAADTLLGRFRRVGKYLVAWNENHELGLEQTLGRTIIDSLQNLALLFWASAVTANPVYREAALAHAHTLKKHIIREDYSTWHCFLFDPLTQQPLRGETFQGYADNSCWSRGQAWAIHGYAQIYEYTGDAQWLETAKHLADYALAHLPQDGIPLWDYCLPEHEKPWRDSSAGAITASGLLLIAQHCTDKTQQDYYQHAGTTMLASLVDQCCLAGNPQAEGLLSEGASFVKEGLCNNMLPYGDYYYLEALMRANGYSDFFWK
ncbi:glycoside hydrolase family 88 protein [Mangrovibacter yixingensis]|uniref:glycoside hydrolase family 88 protein n=1 Tax=Mangrovibacter yixingensis TaxID=1529639 RepID=UPI001CFB4AED|nr:glycoside hydrolase family 88 protein [Mangrovibacter yixingensis]